ncbi:V-type ATPase subunit [Christensenellaceae bacterium OttesenSCG-928-L17]|nr:V-type ATPase subunit [Christensenellaceae bacterium OttesenSCG-928-L17]
MPQSSYAYAVARVRSLEKGLIGRDRLQRLSEGTLEDVVRMLVEAGYGDLPEATAADCETMIAKELEKAALVLQEVTPKPQVTDLFLLKGDIHNLKVLLKARLLDNKEEPFLLAGGLYETEKLAAAVRDHNYIDLPPVIKDALNELEKELQNKEDPQQISIALDRAYLLHAKSVLKKEPDSFAAKYFDALADFNNILTMLRVRAIGAQKDTLEQALLPAGNLSHSSILNAFEQPVEGMAKFIATGPIGPAVATGLEAVVQTGQNSAMEKARDDYLIQLIKKDKYDVMTLQPILGYYLAREQEAKCVRLIVTAKRNGLPEQVIAERLREVYG